MAYTMPMSEDIIANPDRLTVNQSGNALMTVGGTGDVLSGLIGGLMARGHEPIEACEIAAETLGKAAEKLAKQNSSLRAYDLAHLIPETLH